MFNRRPDYGIIEVIKRPTLAVASRHVCIVDDDTSVSKTVWQYIIVIID